MYALWKPRDIISTYDSAEHFYVTCQERKKKNAGFSNRTGFESGDQGDQAKKSSLRVSRENRQEAHA